MGNRFHSPHLCIVVFMAVHLRTMCSCQTETFLQQRNGVWTNMKNPGSTVRPSLADTWRETTLFAEETWALQVSSEMAALQSLTWCPSGCAFPCRTEVWSHPFSLLFLGNSLPHPLELGLQLGMPLFHSSSLIMACFHTVILFPQGKTRLFNYPGTCQLL